MPAGQGRARLLHSAGGGSQLNQMAMTFVASHTTHIQSHFQ